MDDEMKIRGNVIEDIGADTRFGTHSRLDVDAERDYEALIILVEFMQGATIRRLAKRFKKPVVEIELIIRTKPGEVSKWKPLARR